MNEDSQVTLVLSEYYNDESGNFDISIIAGRNCSRARSGAIKAKLDKILDRLTRQKLIDGYLSSPISREIVDIKKNLSRSDLIEILSELPVNIIDNEDY